MKEAVSLLSVLCLASLLLMVAGLYGEAGRAALSLVVPERSYVTESVTIPRHLVEESTVKVKIQWIRHALPRNANVSDFIVLTRCLGITQYFQRISKTQQHYEFSDHTYPSSNPPIHPSTHLQDSR